MKEKYIPGIYNYCDRWCERCAFTERCRNYERSEKATGKETDIGNKKFWDSFSRNMEDTMALLQKAASKYGIDIDQPMSESEETAFEQKRKRVRSAAKKHPVSVLCEQYIAVTLPFVKSSGGLVEHTRQLVSQLHQGIKSEEDVVHTMAHLGNCFEIIEWYLFFISAKLQRALQGTLEGEESEMESGYPKDSDGSAKVAIIAIIRSMSAWMSIYETMPATEDTALQALSLLSRMKQSTETQFPGAINFIRPGFDD